MGCDGAVMEVWRDLNGGGLDDRDGSEFANLGHHGGRVFYGNIIVA